MEDVIQFRYDSAVFSFTGKRHSDMARGKHEVIAPSMCSWTRKDGKRGMARKPSKSLEIGKEILPLQIGSPRLDLYGGTDRA